MISNIIAWFRRLTLYRVKLGMFTFLVGAVTFSITIKVDFINKFFEYSNGSLSIEALLALLLACIVLIGLDVWLEKIKSKERIAKDILKTIREANIPSTLKEEMVNALRKDY